MNESESDELPAELTRSQRNNRRLALRRQAKLRVRERSPVPGCPRPDKPAYDKLRPDERDLQRRMLGPGLEMYDCRCGFSHNGHRE